MSVITFRKGNRISRRTLGFLPACKVIGSPSRSQFARESSTPHGPSAGTLPRERHDSAITRCRCSTPAIFLSSIYILILLSILLSSLFPPEDDLRDLHGGTFTPARRRRGKQVNNLETAACTLREIPRRWRRASALSAQEDKSRLYRRSLITLALRREISFR